MLNQTKYYRVIRLVWTRNEYLFTLVCLLTLLCVLFWCSSLTGFISLVRVNTLIRIVLCDRKVYFRVPAAIPNVLAAVEGRPNFKLKKRLHIKSFLIPQNHGKRKNFIVVPLCKFKVFTKLCIFNCLKPLQKAFSSQNWNKTG